MCSGGSAYNSYQELRNNSYPTEEDAKTAAKSLARLMEKQLGYCDGHIDSVALRLFIRAYWSRISTCVHTIHNSRD